MITTKLVKKDLQNALKALNDKYIYITIMDGNKVIIKDARSYVGIESI